MSNVPSLSSSAWSSPSSSRFRSQTEIWHTRSVRSPARTGHERRRSETGKGRARQLDWENQGSSLRASKAPQVSGRCSPGPPAPYAAANLAHIYQEDLPGQPISIDTCDHLSPSHSASASGAQTDAHYNEAQAPRSFRTSGSLRTQTPAQTHHAHNAGAERTPSVRRVTRLALAQGSPASHITPASPLSSYSPRPCSPAFPRTPTREQPLTRTDVKSLCFEISHSPSVSPLSSTGLRAAGLGAPFEEPCTPSPSPRLQRTRLYRATPPPSPTFLIRKGFAVQRARPTLAMSIQIHAPCPIMSSSSRSLSPPPSASSSARGRSQSRRPELHLRADSPLNHTAQLQSPPRPPMARPSSRSERLLRDTLRRAEEHDRMLSVHPLPSPKLSGASLPASPFLAPTGSMPLFNASPPLSSTASRRHSRKNTASSLTGMPCDLCDPFDALGSVPVGERDTDEEDEGREWSYRTGASTSSSSSSHGHSQSYHHHHSQATPLQPGFPRNRSNTQSSRTGDRTYPDSVAQIAYGTPSSPSPARTQLPRSGTSAPHVGRHAHAQARASPERTGVVTPHEAVLRSRLEGVLRGVKEQERREKSSERSYFGLKEPGSGGSGSGSANSVTSSRNLSAESDLFLDVVGESSVTSLSSAESKTSPTATAASRASFSPPRSLKLNLHSRSPMHSPTTPARQLASPHSQSSANGISPLTPPPTPPFNARTAAEQCRAMDGYISFANIEGLGVPEGAVDEDGDDDDESRSRWWRWLMKRERGGSESMSSIGVAS